MSEAIKFLLADDKTPRAWYNIVADSAAAAAAGSQCSNLQTCRCRRSRAAVFRWR